MSQEVDNQTSKETGIEQVEVEKPIDSSTTTPTETKEVKENKEEDQK